ncbi:MAG: hypothetical protein Q4G60_07165 [bacterium]|nr:hypothetical protein [bacterium]
MQSYKLRKNSETSLFPIEEEIRRLRKDAETSVVSLIYKIIAVIFSGIGTSLVCQNEFLSSLIKSFLLYFSINISDIALYLLEIIIALFIFALLSFILIKLLNWSRRNADNKKNNIIREGTAEYFHKVILNNIITGVSFIKKAKGNFDEMNSKVKKEAEDHTSVNEMDFFDKEIYALRLECCLYIAQAIFYLTLAKDEMIEKKIVELGDRSNYIDFLNCVGFLSLMETLLMYQKTLDDLDLIIESLLNLKCCIWNKHPQEKTLLKACTNDTNLLKKYIALNISKLNDTFNKRV